MRVIVVGAGISGLATAYGLQARGVDVEVLEASGRSGGVIGTVERDGFLLETAANGYLDREPAMRELVDALDLGARLRRADPASKLRFIYTRGALRALPSSPPAFLKSDLLPFGARLRVVRELFSSRGSGEDESIAAFARRHVGERATAVLIDAAQTGIFAGDHEQLSVSATFPRMVELEREHRSLILGLMRQQKAQRRAATPSAPPVLTSFDGGMQSLPEALAQALGGRVHLGTPARALERNGPRWRVRVDGGAFEADHVVLATPAMTAGELVRAFAPELARELAEIPYAPVTVVHVAYRGLAQPPQGFGFLVPGEEKRRVLGAMYVSSFFPWRVPGDAALLTVMVGGARHPELAALSDDELVALVRQELRTIAGLSADPAFTHVVRWPRAIPQYVVGHPARVARIDEILRAHRGLHLTGNAYKGVGVIDCVRNAEALVSALAH